MTTPQERMRKTASDLRERMAKSARDRAERNAQDRAGLRERATRKMRDMVGRGRPQPEMPPFPLLSNTEVDQGQQVTIDQHEARIRALENRLTQAPDLLPALKPPQEPMMFRHDANWTAVGSAYFTGNVALVSMTPAKVTFTAKDVESDAEFIEVDTSNNKIIVHVDGIYRICISADLSATTNLASGTTGLARIYATISGVDDSVHVLELAHSSYSVLDSVSGTITGTLEVDSASSRSWEVELSEDDYIELTAYKDNDAVVTNPDISVTYIGPKPEA